MPNNKSNDGHWHVIVIVLANIHSSLSTRVIATEVNICTSNYWFRTLGLPFGFCTG